MQVGPLFIACYILHHEYVAVWVKGFNVISAGIGMLYVSWI
jgi:hypothetical protein